jgi:hypothetical protein
VVGINTALRISDLLVLKVEHFMDDHHHINQRFWIKEQKQGNRHEVVIKHGKSFLQFANRWVCGATLAHTACEKHGDTTLECKVLT